MLEWWSVTSGPTGIRIGVCASMLVAACASPTDAIPDDKDAAALDHSVDSVAPDRSVGPLDEAGEDGASFDAGSSNDTLSEATSSDGAPADAASEDRSVDATSQDGSVDATSFDGVATDVRFPDGSRPDSTPADAGRDPIERGGFCTAHWCWSKPLPQGNTVSTIWASPTGRVWAGGRAGLLMGWDGARWTRVELDTLQGVETIWGTSDSNVWVADSYRIWHFDGSTWKKDESEAIKGHYFRQISGTASDDVWIAAHNSMGRSAALHFDGTGWTEVVGITNSLLVAVSAPSRSSVYFAGGSDTSHAGLFHWDGVNWTQLTDKIVYALFSPAPDDVWFNQRGDVMRTQGAVFAPVYQKAGAIHSVAPAIFGSSGNDVWVLQDDYWINHWNGSAWTPLLLPQPPYLSGTSSGAPAGVNAAVIGGMAGQVWRVQGDSPASLVPPLSPDGARDLYAVWSDGQGTVLALGQTFLRWSLGADGNDQWSVIPKSSDAGATIGGYGLWGSSASDVWAVSVGVIYHYDGAQITEVPSGLPNPGAVTWAAVDGSSASNVWAVGSKGATAHFDGVKWTAAQSPGVADLTNVWVDPATGDAWACGDSGIVQHYSRATGWVRLTAPEVDLTAIWGTSASDVWVAGSGHVYRYDGTKFVSLPIPGDGPVASLYRIPALRGDGSGGVIAMGEFGLIMRWDGTRWSWEPTTSDAMLRGLWLGPDGRGWAVGSAPPTLSSHHVTKTKIRPTRAGVVG